VSASGYLDRGAEISCPDLSPKYGFEDMSNKHGECTEKMGTLGKKTKIVVKNTNLARELVENHD